MTTDELITNASPEQLREIVQEIKDLIWNLEMDFYETYENASNAVHQISDAITNALEGKE